MLLIFLHVTNIMLLIPHKSICQFRDPWVLPVEAGARQAAICSKQALAQGAGGASDHLALVKAFNGWSAARRGGRERTYCASNFLSSSTMMMVDGMRAQLLGELQVRCWSRVQIPQLVFASNKLLFCASGVHGPWHAHSPVAWMATVCGKSLHGDTVLRGLVPCPNVLFYLWSE